MVQVEVCVNSSSLSAVSRSVAAVYQGGADRVELCSQMERHGLTPDVSYIVAARKAFANRKGLMVMIRPRSGDFAYSQAEIKQMQQQIEAAAQVGADGVVLGVAKNGRLALSFLGSLMQTAKQHHLLVTFHRAFDVLTDPTEALEWLIELGVDRVLTSGTAWGSGKTAVSGIHHVSQYIQQAGKRLEIVIGGGINAANVQQLLSQLPVTEGKVSVHVYSGVQRQGVTAAAEVKELVQMVRAGQRGY